MTNYRAWLIKNRPISEQQNKNVSILQEAGYIKNTVILILPHIQCLDLIYFEVDWVQVSPRT